VSESHVHRILRKLVSINESELNKVLKKKRFTEYRIRLFAGCVLSSSRRTVAAIYAVTGKEKR